MRIIKTQQTKVFYSNLLPLQKENFPQRLKDWGDTQRMDYIKLDLLSCIVTK